jgi:hypothetical protein
MENIEPPITNTNTITNTITNKIIIDTIKKNGFIVIYEKDTEKRKLFHKFAKSKNFYHLSWVDETKDYDQEIKYWCESCDRFLNQYEYSFSFTNFNEQFIYCSRCYDKDDLVNKTIVIKDGYMNDENYHVSKWIKKNNSIVISNDMKHILYCKKN